MRNLFITGTDTDVGKTVAALAVGALLQEKGLDVGVMKPVQCSGDDASRLVNALDIRDEFSLINPYYADDPLSPNVAFKRARQTVKPERIQAAYRELAARHDIMIVEGAGGLLVPIRDDYSMADLARDLDLDVVIVARPGLGTINHTLLTIEQARAAGLHVAGVIFSESAKIKKGVAEKTNPDVIKKLSGVPVLGVIPRLKSFSRKNILEKCRKRVVLPGARPKRTGQTKQLQQWDKKYVWHPFTQMKGWLSHKPLVIDRAKGSYLIDTDGKRYLDGVSSLWVNLHGHGHKKVDQAICRQANKLSHSTLLGLANTPSVELAKKLVDIAPPGLKKVFYSDSGSTAVEIAIKLAYQYWQNTGRPKKKKIVHLANSYHGDTLGSVSIGGIDLFHKVYGDLIFDAIKIDFPDCYRAPRGKKYPDYAFEAAKRLEKVLKAKHNSIAGLVVEPGIQGAAGMVMWPKGVLKEMERLCRKYDVFLIVDEVATGFGRTGKMFACEHEKVRPDFLCLAKGITAGYLPLAATLTTQRVFDGFIFDDKDLKTFFHGHTYTGNPLACAAALANIEIFEKEQTLKKLAPKIKYLAKRLKMFYNLPSVGDVRQRGFMVGIELVQNKNTKKPFAYEKRVGARVCEKARERGVILRPLGNVIVLMPPLSMSAMELDKLLDTTYWAIEEVLTN